MKIVYAESISGESERAFRSALYRHMELTEEEGEFAEALISCVREHAEELDSILSEKVQNFDVKRIVATDKAAMLIALAEIKYFDDIPPVVSVSEAAALARKYSTERSADFVNGVLAGVINQ